MYRMRQLFVLLALLSGAVLTPLVAHAQAGFGVPVLSFSIDPTQPVAGQPATVTVGVVPNAPIALVGQFPVTATLAGSGQTVSTSVVIRADGSGNTPQFTGTLTFPVAGAWFLTAPGWTQAVGNGLAVTVLAAGGSPACHYQLGFAALYDRIPTIVGDCLDNEAYAANGDSVQHTTGGLLVWRKSDNWTAFTDGYRTWVAGPYGLQERLNSQRFPWEAGAGMGT